MGNQKENYKFALCVENKDCEDLEKRKIYQILPDEESEKEGYLRVVDESGEDYLYPHSPISSLFAYPAKRKRRYKYQNSLFKSPNTQVELMAYSMAVLKYGLLEIHHVLLSLVAFNRHSSPAR